MDYKVMYNPLSRNGTNKRVFRKIDKYFKKRNIPYELKSLLDIEDDIDKYMYDLDPNTKMLILGGDGTLNKLMNRLYKYDVKNELFLLKAGTGNDFARSITRKKQFLIKLNPYLKPLPLVTIDDDKSFRFINGVGCGVDGLVAHYVNNTHKKKNKFNYFRETLRAFVNYKPSKMTFKVDDNEFELDKVWLTTIMKAPYLGGGMKMAPNQNRSDEKLTLVTVSKVPKILLFFVFPFIYFGLHKMFTRYVKFHEGKEISVKVDKEVFLQIDGEDIIIKDNMKAVYK